MLHEEGSFISLGYDCYNVNLLENQSGFIGECQQIVKTDQNKHEEKNTVEKSCLP